MPSFLQYMLQGQVSLTDHTYLMGLILHEKNFKNSKLIACNVRFHQNSDDFATGALYPSTDTG